ncbi:MAG: ABC transporter substrate-binding protein [Anaerolineae bacterium]
MKRGFVLLLVLTIALLPSLVFAQDATVEPVAAVPMGTSACAAPANLSGDITIGALFTLSGAASVYGASQQAAVQLAVDEINAAGYLGGATLNVSFADSASDNDQAINAMTQLVEQEGVTAVIGPTLSREAFSADPVAQDAGVPVVAVSNTAIGITDMGDYIFRASLPEAAVIPGVVSQSVELLGFTKVGLLYGNDDDFTVSGYEVMRQAFEDAGVEIVGEETYATGDVDFNAQLTNLLAGSPDVLAVSALAAEAEQIILQARAQGYTGYILGGNGFNSATVLQHTAEASEGLIVGGAWNIGNPNPSGESVAFASAFETAAGHSPDQFAAQAYTGAWLVAEAIRCADSTDHAAVRDALAAIHDFASPLGVFSFDENRDPVHAPIAQIVRGGTFVVLTAETGAL